MPKKPESWYGITPTPDLSYDLPPELIAQEPVAKRDGSRMMRVSRGGGRAASLSEVRHLTDHLESGDLLVRNRTRVFPARLRGQRMPGGGAVEVLLLQAAPQHGPECWQALARPLKRLRAQQKLIFSGPNPDSRPLEASVREVRDGYLWVDFPEGTDVIACAERLGEIPLPPYIQRKDGPTHDDRTRYQTIYARENGSVAAPTAGLHLTEAIFESLVARNIGVAEVVLHVGAATFLAGQPGRGSDTVEPETYFVPPETRARIENCTGRVVAVGTTTTRALESASRQGWPSSPTSTGLVLKPGDSFRVVQGLLTNFHLPGSSLLSLVAAFGGVEPVREAYQRAVAERYRFYSYGDAMLII
jgi:S-adenosylmethionine:tRNA ribosyltransferase-isomerase